MRGWTTAGAALSAMLSVISTHPLVSTLPAAPAVPALERSLEIDTFRYEKATQDQFLS